mmetsp:Transcript_18491/g.23810  ORF Transcript_18491/g.23810 Transcript_18491/m.23810 type:complete len:90 (-) Transcript_18491:359-628(-)
MPPGSSSSSVYWSLFQRAIGLKQGFRRSGSSSLVHIAVASGVGVISGFYIFKDPLEEYGDILKERQAGEQLAASTSSTGGSQQPSSPSK